MLVIDWKSKSLGPRGYPGVEGSTNTHLPKLLTCVLAGNTLEDLWTTRMFINEISDVVDIVVDNNEQALVGRVMRSHFGRCECLRHYYATMIFYDL